MSRTMMFSLVAALGMAVSATASSASGVLFTFSEVGNDVVMVSSGSIDTRLLTLSGTETFGGTGIETNDPGEVDIMGSDAGGAVTSTFTFSAGTDASAWTNPGGMFGLSFFGFSVTSGSKSFATYPSDPIFRSAGLGVRGADIVDGIWTPDMEWLAAGQSLASLQLNEGVFGVTDVETGAMVTIVVGESEPEVIPLPAGLPMALAGFALLGFVARRRRSD